MDPAAAAGRALFLRGAVRRMRGVAVDMRRRDTARGVAGIGTAFLFYFFSAGTYASCVNQFEIKAIETHLIFNNIPCGAGDMRNDGAFLV